ncbi:hypothetical protein JKY79_02590, partial [Candidatus Babeliales bacterium]|nr:hypothetical protein [Candidatus Babeliales bacterium]
MNTSVSRRVARLLSILIFLICEACSMKQEETTEKNLQAVTPHIKYEIPHEKIRHEKLENGMNILMMKDTTVPQVLVQVGYEVGSADEGVCSSEEDGDSGERGYAHL